MMTLLRPDPPSWRDGEDSAPRPLPCDLPPMAPEDARPVSELRRQHLGQGVAVYPGLGERYEVILRLTRIELAQEQLILSGHDLTDEGAYIEEYRVAPNRYFVARPCQEPEWADVIPLLRRDEEGSDPAWLLSSNLPVRETLRLRPVDPPPGDA